MKTLIAYATRYGCARKAAEALRDLMGGEVTLVDLKEDGDPDPGPFDAVIVGGSIQAGSVQRRVRAYCEKRSAELLGKRLGLYLCCMYEGEVAAKQLADAFPERLRNHATASGLFGGELDFERIGFVARLVVKKVAGVTESVFRFDDRAVQEFVRKMRD
ncbi:MAG: flavodoxin domain-containing protein [Proteobacteria bacterium]|jgi:menaquinone-dependent protoporphyrinogen oxidase|nr:flavodoxin domain-containing protein [Pseudomonadota bacterium]